MSFLDEAVNGLIDEVMIFNRTLSATEISDIYTQTFTKFNTDVGNHTIKPTNITNGFDRVNVTLNHNNQNFTNLSLRMGQINANLEDMSGVVL